ncbi:MAG: response regulator transcription factor [bacterium]|nr:response regulator transcription factor [bacterium]
MSEKILIIEDDIDIADLVDIHLQDLNYPLDRATDGKTGLAMALSDEYLLVILDLMLPELDGLEVCKRIRAEKPNLPILMLTSKSEEFDKVLGLEIGADDYVTKPFSIREFIARVKALIRRTTENEPTATDQKILSFAELTIDLENRKVTLANERIELTAKEFDLLALFASNPGRTYSRERLLDMVWEYRFTGYNHTVNSHINRLRTKIERNPSQPVFIRTVWGVGYRFAERKELDHAENTE